LARVIGHVDLDYFYAQVEEVENPSIKGRPVAVCVFSGRTEDSGVVSTANYKAREFGVRSGMPITAAKKRLEGKDPVIIRMDIAKYEAVSERIMELVRSRVDIIEKAGIDEAFFDLTDSSQGDYTAAADAAKGIKQSILEEEHLTCSIGLGRTKVVAKLASDTAKPGGLLVVLPESTESFLGGLDVARLYGVGPKTTTTLGELGIKTVAELARADIVRLEKPFGRKLAFYLHAAANGEDDDPVRENQAPTQFSRIITLKDDTTDPEEAMNQLAEAEADLRSKLAARETSFRTVSAIAIFTDLSTKTRSKTFETPIKDLSTVRSALVDLFSQMSETADREFRRVGIRVSDLSTNPGQKSLAEFIESP
jgi:DNA polymerase IV (archaeal DinB-like DNA polymerase)